MTRAPRPEVALLQSRAAQVLRKLVWPLAGVALAVLAAWTLTPALLAALPLTIFLGIYVAMQAWTVARRGVARGEIGLFDGEITVGRGRLCDRSSITSGTVIPGTVDGALVRLERGRRGAIDLAVSSSEQGEEVLELLGLDAAHAVARFRVQGLSLSAWKRRMWTIVASAICMGAGGVVFGITRMPWMFPLLVLPFVFFALAMALPGTLVVGTDGLVVRRLGRTRFVPLDGVADALVDDSDTFMNAELSIVRLVDAHGDTRAEILVDQKKQGPLQEGLHADVDARAHALAERIRETIALRKASTEPFDRSSLARGDRDAADWVTHLAGLLTRTSTFRDQGPPTEAALLAIVEDAASPPVDRAAAAAALSRASPPIKRRVRVAAEAIAAPKLRVALEAASEGETERLAEALADVEALERAPHR
ncbi:MAG: hypothetical protein HYV09_20530 [Deltaproteobacteria bacterium]|nr:hypothetical protein [Deltaproteobacteria bacterium]